MIDDGVKGGTQSQRTEMAPLLVNLGFNPWSPYWKRNQSLVYSLLQRGTFSGLLFVNREMWPGDLVKHPTNYLRGLGRYWAGAIRPRTIEPNVTIFTPLVMNRGGRFRVLNSAWLRRVMPGVRGGTKKRAVVLVNNLSEFSDAVIADLPIVPINRVFDISDDFSKFSSNHDEQEAAARACEREFQRADLVLSVNDRVNEWALRFNPHSITVRNATNVFLFAKGAEDVLRRVRPDFFHLKRPLIGYVGWMNSLRLDIPLLEEVIAKRPDWTFLFLGPKVERYPLGETIPRFANVRIWEPVEYAALPAVIASLDVAILPNLTNPHTDGNDPIKIYDYLASGRPVVATNTAGTEQFPGLLRLAENASQFLAALDDAVGETDTSKREARIAAARVHSWANRAEQVEQALRCHVSSLQSG
jgi:glycosyltransferase involved in cell wall biosynthesis